MLEGLRWFKNSSFLWDRSEKIYIDPWGVPPDAPPADAILITHTHDDHFRPKEIARLRQSGTQVWGPVDAARQLEGDVNVVAPGDAFEVLGHSVDAVPAYNVREDRLRFHPKVKRWVGYVIAFEGVRFYHAGDTDLIPDMESVSCDVAMLPVGGTFTMDPTEAAEAARLLSPKIVVPMHYGYVAGSPSDARRFADLAEDLTVHAFVPENPFER